MEFEYPVRRTIIPREGAVEGFFAVQHGDNDNRGILVPINRCFRRLAKRGAKVIAVITDEFCLGSELDRIFVPQGSGIAGVLTFGKDTFGHGETPYDSHLQILVRQMVDEPEFVAAIAHRPDNRTSYDWRHTTPLSAIDMQYGRLTVSQTVCAIELLPAPDFT